MDHAGAQHPAGLRGTNAGDPSASARQPGRHPGTDALRRDTGCPSNDGVGGPALRRAATVSADVPVERVTRPLIGVLPGEGVGPIVLDCALRVLAAIEAVSDIKATIETGGPIGLDARRTLGCDLSPDVEAFVSDIFAGQGAILAGPGGGRFVYDLRKRFDLYVKFSPLKPPEPLLDATRLKAAALADVDIVVARDNIGGLYQGRSSSQRTPDGERSICHELTYTEGQVRRLATAGARLAATRTGRATVAIKAGGLPQLSDLWSEVVGEVCAAAGVEMTILDADHCAYELIQHPKRFDVLIAPNAIGDMLTDIGTALLGSRGLAYGGSFAPIGHGVYQTNHGSAMDLVGTDRVNPGGQILALALMLRESFNLQREAGWIEAGLSSVWRQGWHTADLAMAGAGVVGTEEFTRRVAQAIADGPPEWG